MELSAGPKPADGKKDEGEDHMEDIKSEGKSSGIDL